MVLFLRAFDGVCKKSSARVRFCEGKRKRKKREAERENQIPKKKRKREEGKQEKFKKISAPPLPLFFCSASFLLSLSSFFVAIKEREKRGSVEQKPAYFY